MTRTIYIAAMTFLFFMLLAQLYTVDWGAKGFLPIATLLILSLLLLALLNFRYLVLFLILSAPTIFMFNYIKINISSTIPFVELPQILMNPISVLYLLIIFISIITIIEKKDELKRIPLRIIIPLSSFYVILSVLWSIDKQLSFIEAIYYIVPFCFFALSFLLFNSRKHFLSLVYVVLGSSIIPVIISLRQIISGDYFYEPSSTLGRITGTFTHPNSYGLFLFLILAVGFIFLVSKRKNNLSKNKTLALSLLLLFVLFVMTYSRVSWAALVLFVGIMLLAKKKIFIPLALSSPIIIGVLMLFENIRMRIMDVFISSNLSSWTARTNIWKISLKEFLDKPIFGHGIGTSSEVIEKAKTWIGGTSLPHNDFVLFGLELGIIGILFYTIISLLAIFLSFKYYTSFKKTKEENLNIDISIFGYGLFVILISILFSGLFESTSQKIIIQIIIWSLVGGFFGIANKEKSHTN